MFRRCAATYPFNILQGQGFTNSQLSVRGVGGAVPVGQFTDAAASVIGRSSDNLDKG